MKPTIRLSILAALAAACVLAPLSASAADALPGVVPSEAVTVTAVPADTGVTVRKVSFVRSNHILLVGNLFLPPDFDPARTYPAILSVHPAGSVKEQSSGLYAFHLARAGFVTLAFDSTYAGESGGDPYRSEMPWDRIEDIRYAIDFLDTLSFVDPDRIGALGICAGGGYVIGAAPTERRIRAVAGVSAADIGAANRESWLGGRSKAEQIAILEDVAAQRTREARGEPLRTLYMCPEPDEHTAPSFREGYEYYRTARAYHPRADNLFLYRSQASKMAYSAIENSALLTQPVLLIAGSEADSKWQTDRFYAALPEGHKEILLIPGACHIDMYDKPQYVEPAVAALAAFFRDALA